MSWAITARNAAPATTTTANDTAGEPPMSGRAVAINSREHAMPVRVIRWGARHVATNGTTTIARGTRIKMGLAGSKRVPSHHTG